MDEQTIIQIIYMILNGLVYAGRLMLGVMALTVCALNFSGFNFIIISALLWIWMLQAELKTLLDLLLITKAKGELNG